MNAENIPPLLIGWAENLLKESTPAHIKENYANTLRSVNEFIVAALDAYASDKAKAALFNRSRR